MFRIFLDDIVLVDREGPLDIETAPISLLVETYWNASVLRVRAATDAASRAPVVH